MNGVLQIHRVRLGHATFWLAATLLVGTGSPAAAELPPIARLLQEAEQACDQAKEADDPAILGITARAMACDRLAKAHFLRGDMDKAREFLHRVFDIPKMRDNAFRWLIIEVTGEAPELPADLTPAEVASQRIVLASVFMRQGGLDKAREQIMLAEKRGGNPRFCAKSYLRIAGLDLEAGNREAAVQSCKSALRCFEAPGSEEYRKRTLLEIARSFAKCGDAKTARLLAEEAERGSREEEPTESETDPGARRSARRELIKRWAELGDIHLMVGDDRRAKEFYVRARRELDALEDTDQDFGGDRAQVLCDFCCTRADACLVAGRKAEALKSLAQATRWWKRQKIEPTPELVRDFMGDMLEMAHFAKLRTISRAQQEAGDADAAVRTVKLMPTSDLQIVFLIELAKTAASHGGQNEARPYLEAVLSADDGSFSSLERASMLAAAAAIHLEVSDREAARRCLESAIEASEAAEQKAHANIALLQIEAGFLDEAYQTAQQIESVGERALPLATLAERIARRQSKRAGD